MTATSNVFSCSRCRRPPPGLGDSGLPPIAGTSVGTPKVAGCVFPAVKQKKAHTKSRSLADFRTGGQSSIGSRRSRSQHTAFVVHTAAEEPDHPPPFPPPRSLERKTGPFLFLFLLNPNILAPPPRQLLLASSHFPPLLPGKCK